MASRKKFLNIILIWLLVLSQLNQALPILALESEANFSSSPTATISAFPEIKFNLDEILKLQTDFSEESNFSGKIASSSAEKNNSLEFCLSQISQEATSSAEFQPPPFTLLKEKIKKPYLRKDHFKAGEKLEIELGDYELQEVEISLSDSSGVKVEVEEKLLIEAERIKIGNSNQFKPGKYHLKVTTKAKDITLLEQDFEWGVLAINPNKSIYLPQEQVKLAIAILDGKGMIACNAEIFLKIMDPEGKITEFSTHDGSIKVNPECKRHDYIEKPDYEAIYQTKGTGAYLMELLAKADNKEFLLNDSFEVKEEVNFDMERLGPTRIYPLATYPMSSKIIFNQDFNGVIEEVVPANFQIIPFDQKDQIQNEVTESLTEEEKILKIITDEMVNLPARSHDEIIWEGDLQKIRWHLVASKGEELRLGYLFDAPDLSPQFYLLEPLKFLNSEEETIFSETKPWQIISEINFDVLGVKEKIGRKVKFKEKEVEFSHTDENANENLIIISDQKNYYGLTQAETYFSVSNFGNKVERINLQTYFSNEEAQVLSLQMWGLDEKWQDIDLFEEKSLTYNQNRKKSVPEGFTIKEKSENQNQIILEPGETKYLKMEIKFPLNSSGEFFIEAIGDKEGYGLLDPWWSSNWAYQKSITIDHDRVGIIADLSSNASSGQKNVVVDDGSLFAASETVVIKDDSNEEIATISSVSSNTLTMQDNLTNSYTTAANAFVKNTTDSTNLTNFPFLINLASDSDLASDAQDDGDDIAFTSSDETTQLDHEIENFNGTTGELQAWVEIPTLSVSSDTVLYIYYGNGSCETQEDIAGTWESNFKLVHHLNDVTTSTTEDSTSNNNDATKKGANEPAETDGKIGKAQNFDGSNDYSSIANTVVTSPAALTISSWFKKPSDGPSYECALHQSSDTTIGNSSYWLGVDVDNRLTATIGARTGVTWSAGQTTTTATYGEWYHLAASWDGSVVRVYINGVYNKQYNLPTYSNLTDPTRFGASSDGLNYQFKGVVDEVRISTAYRGPDWIKTSYSNQNSPSSFYSLGTEEGKPLLLEQSHYHWRNDDGSESSATSATDGSEDTVLDINPGTRKRVRVEISNEGSENSTDVEYRLEYGEKSTTCGAISSWVDVGFEGGDWDMSATDNLTDGDDTTNIAESIGGVTDENTTFETPNAAVKDTSSQTGNISLSTSEYVEIEYSVIANGSAAGKNYCFRLTDAGSATDFVYPTYAEAIIPKLEQIHYRWRSDDGGEGDTTSWYNGSWAYRKKITIDHTKVEDDHADFPIVVHLDSSETDFWSHCSAESEVVFTQSDGTTKLKREVETFDHTNDDLYAWVKIPTMDKDEDLDIYLYYGYGSASETNDTDVWDSNFKMVQHLDDLTTSTTEDSTSNNNDATKKAANEPIETDGKIGKAQSFDGTNDYNKIANNFITSPTSLTISSWIKKESGGSTYEVVLHKASNTNIGASDYWLGVCTDDYLTATIGANQSGIGWMAGQTTTKVTYGQWYHLAASWNGSVVRIYINGVYDKQYNLSSYGNLTTYPTRFGASSDGAHYQFKGVADEVRISTAYRGDNWIKTSYNNQNDPASFHTVGSEQAGVGASWEEDEDTAASVEKNTLIRVRFEISNEGSSTLTGTTYRIEYGEKSSTCGDISSWSAVPDTATTEHWETTASTNLTEGGATTNVAGGLTDENITFVAGETREAANQTSGITLTSAQFTEIEYSIQATNNATGDGDYCLRLTNAGSATNFVYTRYAEISIFQANQSPNSPSSLVQKKTDDTILNTGDWLNENSVKFTATTSDPDGADTLYLCVEKDNLSTSFSDSEDLCGVGVGYTGTPVTVTVTITGISDQEQYHWQARIKDEADAYSSWVSYDVNDEDERDFGLDGTAPTGGMVYDGEEIGVDIDFNNGSLSELSANWGSFDADISELDRYEYSIGTSIGGTEVGAWINVGVGTSVNETGLDLQTSVPYYFNVRAVDNAGNTQTAVSSDGQIVSPSLTFSVAPAVLSFDNLNSNNGYSDEQETTLTTSTNAYGGYVIRSSVSDYLRSSQDFTIGDFDNGSYESPGSWGGGNYGFGYTSSDTTIQGSNKFGGETLWAPFSQEGLGDIVADYTDNITGTPISDDQHTVTYKVKTDAIQESSLYVTTVFYTITAMY